MDYIVSFRKSITSRFSFATEPIVIKADTGEVLSVDHLAEGVIGKRCLFLIHGYSNSYTDALTAYKTISANLTRVGLYGSGSHYDVVIGVLWPGHTAAGFWMAVPGANKAGIQLADLLTRIGPSSIDIEAHSLGNRVMFECMDNLYPVTYPVNNLFSFAAAIDDESLEEKEKYHNATKKCDKVIVGCSKADSVLGKWYRRFGSWPWNLVTGGDVALGYYGPTDLKKCFKTISVFDATEFKYNHGSWKCGPEVYWQWLSWVGKK